jgi:hypothetical protein
VNNEILYWGLKFSELVTLIGIIVGPIVAVAMTLVIEAKRRQHDSKIQIMRMILNTRHLPADPSYNAAINLIPVEFNRDKTVMDAWKDYISHVRFKPSDENKNEHNTLSLAKQTTMIFRLMKNLKFNLSETEIQTSAYASEGSIIRDNLYLDSLHANVRIANALEHQTIAVQNSLKGREHILKNKAKTQKKAPNRSP